MVGGSVCARDDQLSQTSCWVSREKGGVGVLLYVSPASLDPFMLKESLKPLLHDYLVPLHIIALDTIPADPALLPAPPKGRFGARNNHHRCDCCDVAVGDLVG